MAKGDVIADISADNAIMDIQPGAGVEYVITWFRYATSVSVQMYDGSATTTAISTGSPNQQSLTNQKLYITNSNYARLPAQGAGANSAYSAIQTK